MKHPRPKTPITLGPPTGGDLGMLRSILGSIHCLTPDTEVTDLIRRRLERAQKRNNLFISDEVRKSWYDAALAIHHENAELYRAVMTGAIG